MRFLIIIAILSGYLFSSELPDNYYQIKDIKNMKRVFFNFIRDIAIDEHKKISEDRQYLKENFNTNDARIKAIKKRYALDKKTLKQALCIVDVIPISLVLAQSAIESGWGKSKFFKEAKNIFGQWTWSGKGLIPLQRGDSKKHKIKIFSSYQQSIKHYLININKGWAYQKLRDLRRNLREQNKPLSGYILANGLDKYSELKNDYVKLVQNIINYNKLYRYDIKFLIK